jgi:hypothetical protein
MTANLDVYQEAGIWQSVLSGEVMGEGWEVVKTGHLEKETGAQYIR